MVQNLKKLSSDIDREIVNNSNPGGANAYGAGDLEGQPMKLKQDDFEKYSAQQVVQMQKEALKSQDKHLDDIKAITGQIKYEAVNFNEEVTDQNRMLDTLNNDMEKTEKKFDTANKRLDKFIRNSNQTCLWCIIICEIIALVCILLFI
jgi:t-SNARE complex subunit (syntaxin)